MEKNFNHIACIHCAWCCQRVPCPLAIYLGENTRQACSHLLIEDGESFCGLMARETDTLKKEALKMLIFSGQGCSHKYGPHPRFMAELLVKRGLTPQMREWQQMKQGTFQDFKGFQKQNPMDVQDLSKALSEFDDFCRQLEQNG